MALANDWKRTVDDGLTNKDWDAYDNVIRTEAADYNRRFAATPGFVAFDWKLFKAVVWVESGGPSNAAWKGRAMQIGNTGDPGYHVLLNGEEAANLIMSDSLRTLVRGNISDPTINIRAGIAYLLNRLVKTQFASIADPGDSKLQSYTVRPGDSWSRISSNKALGTTQTALMNANPGVKVMQPGMTLQVPKASMQRVVTGWNAATPGNVARFYNGGRDSNYASKLEYVLSLFPKLQRGKTAPVK